MVSDIQIFFRNKVVLITGGTGFLGKVLIEKLVRSTDIKFIYLLVRHKKDKDVNERINELINQPIFEKLLSTQPNILKSKIKPIVGDCTLPNLGLSQTDRQDLIDNVNVVMHCAATVRFNEPLYEATQINVAATKDLLEIAKEMKNLKVFVHVSSAFANCLVLDSEEKFYTEYLSVTSDKLLSLKEELEAEVFNRMESTLIGKFPNTYCFTKSLAEEVVLKHGSVVLPICIFRSPIIVGSCDEPVPGWVDNLYGPLSICYGCGLGVLRVINARSNLNAGFAPVDYCVNSMLASAWYTAKKFEEIKPEEPPIFTLVPSKSNTLTWENFRNFLLENCYKMPASTMIWCPILIFAESEFAYTLLTFIYHLIPGLLIDLSQVLLGKSPRMIKIYKKIHKQCRLIKYFTAHDFTFDTRNCNNLWTVMSPDDQKMFNFNMSNLDWPDYLLKATKGMRLYLVKEDPSTIPKACEKLKIFVIANYVVHGVVLFLVMRLIWFLLQRVFSTGI
ncbi:fatty acyl-CoA reductase wat-like [Haematobia irritans]|uniref:fatty acyl-CoA reductase wat-like n=1 Tax=Haematobia irritans TaxID=7368 RepID=UPI003F500008